jgi:zinc protease
MAELLARTLAEARAGEVEALGGRIGAYVTNDDTVFWARGLAEDFDQLLSLLIDTVSEPRLDRAGLAVTRDRMRGELRLDRSMPGAVARRRLMAALYGEGHPLGRSVTSRSLSRVTLKQAIQRVSRCYGAAGARLVVVGDVEPERFTAAVERAAGPWLAGEPLPPVPQPAAALDGQIAVRVKKKGLTQSSIILGWPGIARTDTEYERFLVFNHVLGGGGFASRLMQAVRVEEGRTYGIRSSAAAGLSPGPVTVTTATIIGGADETVATIRRELELLLDEGITASELDEAKQYLLGRRLLARSTPDGLASRMIAEAMLGLDTDPAYDPAASIEAVDAEAALATGRRFFDPENFVLLVVGD